MGLTIPASISNGFCVEGPLELQRPILLNEINIIASTARDIGAIAGQLGPITLLHARADEKCRQQVLAKSSHMDRGPPMNIIGLPRLWNKMSRYPENDRQSSMYCVFDTSENIIQRIEE